MTPSTLAKSRRAATIVACAAATLAAAGAASADPLPYTPSGAFPRAVSSPPMADDAPWTPTVRALLHQLEPHQPDPQHDAAPAPGTTIDQLLNADKLLHLDAANVNALGIPATSLGCTAVGSVAGPTGTTPAIPAQCWTDGQGIMPLSGAQVRRTTATMNKTGLAASWDPAALNAWGQAEGVEGRALGITGIYGPQVDLVRIPNWGRNVAVLSEDPFASGTLGAAEINGIQGKGLMAQVKHFAFYDGQDQGKESQVQDQAAHELYMTPYEYGTSGSGVLAEPGQASSMMCSYATFSIVNAPGISGVPSVLSPNGGAYACNNPIKNVVTHDLWHWPGFNATDYIVDYDLPVIGFQSGSDQDFTAPTAAGPAGAPLVAAVQAGVVKLSAFNLAVARILYQFERFHLLGHADGDSDHLSPSAPIDAVGRGEISEADKARHAAIVERGAEEGGVLLKNAGKALPLSRRALRKGILVVGESAEYMSANPGTETAAGYPDRDAISPLQQLKALAPKGSRITYLPYMPGKAPTPTDGVPAPLVGADGTTTTVDFTKVSGKGQLAFGHAYTWSGDVDVPRAEDYTFRLQFSVPGFARRGGAPGSINNPGEVTPPTCDGAGAPTFTLDAKDRKLVSSPPVLGSQNPPQTNPTMSGYTERGLANCAFPAGTLSPGKHHVTITWTAPAAFADDVLKLREPGSAAPSFRFAVSRARTDEADAIAAARQAAQVVVFSDCECVNEGGGNKANLNPGNAEPTELVRQMAAANPNTVVVTNYDVATELPWLDQVRAVLQMWYPGSEGGTATARLLLGLANPSGHLPITWPRDQSQTIWAHRESRPLYPGDAPGVHKERFTTSGTVIPWNEGIFMGYRFFDREDVTPLFPFGYGLSYTSFRYSKLRTRTAGRGVDATFTVTNTGGRSGTAVPQLYVGPAAGVPAGVQQADRALAGWARVTLRPHRSRRITVHLGPGRGAAGWGHARAFQYWYTPKQAWQTASGPRRLWVADADAPRHLRLTATADVPA